MKKVLCIAFLVVTFVLAACGSVATQTSQVPNGASAQQSTVQVPDTSAPVQPPQPTVTQTAPAAPTPKPTTPTPVASQDDMPKVPGLGSEGGPVLGGSLSTFTKMFGKPYSSDVNDDGSTSTIWDVNNGQATLMVSSTGGRVTEILIMTSDKVTWSTDRLKMVAFGTLFLPADIVQSDNTTTSEFDRYTYTTIVGNITLLVNGGSVNHWQCTIDFE